MKKRDLKTGVAALLCASMMLGLAGCGGSKAETATTAAATTAAAKTEGEKAVSAETEAAPLEELTVTMMVIETASQMFPTENVVVDKIKEKFNINLVLQPVPNADFNTKVATTLGSGQIPDIMANLTADQVGKYAPTGMFLNLNDYKDSAADYLDIMYADDRIEETKKMEIEGSLYGFIRLQGDYMGEGNFLGIRTDLLEEQGIPTPTTFAEYYDAMLKIKEKHPEMYGLSTRKGTNYLIGMFAYPLGSGGFPSNKTTRGVYYEPDTDSYIYGPTSDKFVRAVEFLRNAYADGLLDPDYATMNQADCWEKISSGKLMSNYDNNTFMDKTFNPALKEIDPNARMDIVRPMANEDGVIRARRFGKDWPDKITVISSRTKDPQRVVEMLNWLYTEEGMKVSNFGEEGKDYTIENGTVLYTQEIIDRHTDDSNVPSGIRGELAAGLHGLAHIVDSAVERQLTPDACIQGDIINDWTKEGIVEYLPVDPSFTAEENARVAELESNLNNIFTQSIDGFITGKTSMDEWPAFVEQLKSQGVEELESIFNAAYDRVK